MTLSLIRVEPDEVQLHVSGWRGRAAGYDVSAYLLGGILVDTGFPGVRTEMMRAVHALAPRGVVVTHWHEDHAGNAPALAAAGVPLLMHPVCEATLRERPRIRIYRHIVWGQTRRLDVPLNSFDPAPLQVIGTPGHSEDHVVVWDAERRIVASGDLFLGVKVRVAHSHESPAMLVRSLRAVAALEPRLLLDAHRGPVANPAAVLRAKIAWLEDTIGEIRTLAVRGLAEREIQRRVLGAETMTGWVSGGEYSKASLVHAVLHERSP